MTLLTRKTRTPGGGPPDGAQPGGPTSYSYKVCFERPPTEPGLGWFRWIRDIILLMIGAFLNAFVEKWI